MSNIFIQSCTTWSIQKPKSGLGGETTRKKKCGNEKKIKYHYEHMI